MTGEQALAFGLVGAVVALLVWDRLRYDVVALLALVAAVLSGLVPAEEAFTGFADEIVIIIGSALVVSAGIARSGVVDTLVRPFAGLLSTPTRQIAFLAGSVGVLSALMKNIGALAIFLPVATQLARRHRTGSHKVLMPMAFASLMGGLMTLIGTSPNIIVSRVREEITGRPFAMFDYLPVGAGLMLAGWVFLLVGWRLLPKERQGTRPAEETFAVEDYVSEVYLPEGSPFVGRTVADLERLSEGEAQVTGLIRERFRRYTPAADWALQAEDVIVLRGDAPALQRIIRSAGLSPVGAPKDARSANLPVYEAVVLADSPLVAQTARRVELGRRRGVNLLAIGRRGSEIAKRLQHFVFKEGDLLLFQLSPGTSTDAVADAGLLPLAERNLQIGRRRPAWLPVGIMAAAMLVLAFQLLPVAVTFLAAALAMVVSGVLKPEEAEKAIEWPILILVGALIPVSATLQTTGGTDLIAGWLAGVSRDLPAVACVTLIMAAAMAVTPFLNNAATVLVMAPIGAGLARELGLNPDPFLMAVAVGAGSDFLTPVGHQCNTLVMAPGGYRFADYPRLGIPLSLLILTLGTFLIVTVWPL
ncbi:SLC13 family permease [Phenylobacterium sp.]|uniref:SLC13 family permease n=1 Tax=Phenylobacterium sp. TaxID=1871053 RepID=UPI002E34FE1A|nr:SLC13 family permease [Phenylobacterium sp.]HEX2559213.1 SLC13 family permease [Phenylobacterium sp.]